MSDTFKKGRRNGHRAKGWFTHMTFNRPQRIQYKRILKRISAGADEEQVFPHPRKPKDYFD